MKSLLVIPAILFSLSALASDKTTVDCAKGAEGIVKINVKNERITLRKAGELAYNCLMTNNTEVRNAKAKALRAARAEGDSYMSKKQCAQTSEDLEFIVLKSWIAGRPGVDAAGDAEMSSDETLLVRQPFTCGAIGTGLFDGVVSSVNVSLELSEGYKFNIEDDNKPTTQEINIKLKGVLSNL